MKMGQIVQYQLGDREHARLYVAIILKVLDEESGMCLLRVINEGRGSTVQDFNSEVPFSEEPKSLRWSYLQTD